MISSSLKIVDIQRPVEVPQEGLLCDILWSDPDKVFMLLLTYIIRLLGIIRLFKSTYPLVFTTMIQYVSLRGLNECIVI